MSTHLDLLWQGSLLNIRVQYYIVEYRVCYSSMCDGTNQVGCDGMYTLMHYCTSRLEPNFEISFERP
jgi:hypothetical protein